MARHVLLARAVVNSQNGSLDAAGDSQGWILRDSFDEILGTTDDDDDDDELGAEDEEDTSDDDDEDEDEDGLLDYKAAPNRMICPITQRIMKDPQVCSDGHTYELKAIVKWFRKHSTSPMTNLVIEKTTIPNRALKEEIQEWIAQQKSGGGGGGGSAAAAAASAGAGLSGAGGALPLLLASFFSTKIGLSQAAIDPIIAIIEETGATEPEDLADLLEEDSSPEAKEYINAITKALPLAKQKRFQKELNNLVSSNRGAPPAYEKNLEFSSSKNVTPDDEKNI